MSENSPAGSSTLPVDKRFRFIDSLDLAGKTVLIRADFNVPLDANREVADDTRLTAVLPTINYALEKNARVVLMSHLGRPKGKKTPEAGLAPVARRLSRLLNKDVAMAPDCIGDEVKQMVARMKGGEVLLLENLRFYPEEEANDDGFAKTLAELGDVYINDAFAVSHRANASVEAVTRFARECGAGFLMKNELSYFYKAMDNPVRPFVAIIGGAKVSSKMSVLKNLLTRIDKLIIGGAMANTFLRTMYPSVGAKSLVEEDLIETARGIIDEARAKGVKLFLPVDCVAADRLDAGAEYKVAAIQDVPGEWMIADIGPATALLYGEAVRDAGTIVWNGPMGAFEIPAFSRGTTRLVGSVVNSYALTIVGGGDINAAVNLTGEAGSISYMSTGGGAFLELLEGASLPGVAALEERARLDRTVR